ncbi:serine O-acetyltransferase EpsC [Gynurincola endophyticus]|jgi:serine O-acetyltransferase|uniref:serine O-acetyltransferase EpsC n=1 Tax=Gynurincola endophyticus TaxID=2479004 RepID=UPI000F8D3C8C|nr:serine O-acetyltransferase EpsC [Gynurincola endophyticus]
MSFYEQLYKEKSNTKTIYPDKESVTQFVDQLIGFLFSPQQNKIESLAEYQYAYEGLESQLTNLVYEITKDEFLSQQITSHFFEQLPAVHQLLLKDADTILQHDPAADSIEEVTLTYPGFYAISVYRFAHVLWKKSVKGLPRLLTEYAHSKTGIDIHPGAIIGESFFIDHGTGIVIGETAVIGDHVKLYQGVTLGAIHSDAGRKKIHRHPSIGNNVIIYSGATLLGNIHIGENSIIGGNVWITYSVPGGSLVYHKSEVIARKDFDFDSAVHEILFRQ